MPKGKIKNLNFDRRFGFITMEGGRDIHFRLQEVDRSMRWENLREGMEVTFEIAQGMQDRPTAIRIKLAGNPEANRAAQTQKSSGSRFLNPYNFARYLPEPPARADRSLEEQRMGRCRPPSHEHFEGMSGKITCTMTAVTPLFVSQGKPTQMEGSHPVYHFYRENGKKVIPSSALKGMVRTIFEVVTNSCFSTIDHRPLSYRLEPGRAGYLVPARIEEKNGAWGLRLLLGTAELSTAKKPAELYPASVRQYKAMRPSGKYPNQQALPPVDLSPLGGNVQHPAEYHGRECWAVMMKRKFPPSWRVLAVAPDQLSAQKIMADLKKQFSVQAQFLVCAGYLCITNQNIDNKASERFFFDGIKSGSTVIPLPEAIREKYSALIADYQDRHHDDVQARKNPAIPVAGNRDMPGFSRFIINRSERYPRSGDLVYAMLHGNWPNVQLETIAPVSIPRIAYDHSPADLLPEHLRYCETYDSLCPACRMFGWARKGSSKRNEPSGYRGRVRFSSATLEKAVPVPAIRLAELGSPKPTTTRFYLADPKGKTGQGRSDEECGYDGNQGKNTLRGRKIYRHFTPSAKFLVGKEANNRNRTIQDPEGEGAQFTFDVRFENLYPEELGALLWALTMGNAGVHKVGLGKPLGLGSVKVGVKELDVINREHRYASLDVLSAFDPRNPDEFTARFFTAVVGFHTPDADWNRDGGVEAHFHALAPVKDLLALLGEKQPALPVHYPYSPDPDSKGSFEWFVGNKRVTGPRIEMDLAADDKGLPFIDKRGTIPS